MMEPEVRYCTTSDGVRIAYTVTGEGPPQLHCADPVISHVQLEWSHPVGGRILREFARSNTLIRFDARGCGLSDRVLPKTLDEQVLDIEAVVQRTGFEQFALTALQLATPAAIAFAARHPEQVNRMVIQDGFSRPSELLGTQQVQALLAAAKVDWVLATEAIGYVAFGAGQDANKVHGEFIRKCIGPEYFESAETAATWDASELARSVTAPTLVIKSNVQFVPVDSAKDLVARIPNAQLLVIEGTSPGNLETVAQRTRDFINGGVAESRPAPELPSGTAVILFADIVDSTALTERFGDAAFREKARGLDSALRTVIHEHAGTPIEGKLLGDGVLAVFTSARQAIEAALACGRAGDEGGLPLHLGLHAGDVIREDNNVYGGAVNVASRISALSAPGEVLASETVRSLARTSSGVRFEDRGEQALKGVGEPVRIWAVRESV
jgi:class 3 adenylate cyclase